MRARGIQTSFNTVAILGGEETFRSWKNDFGELGHSFDALVFWKRGEREQIEVDERILEKEGGGRAHGVFCIRSLEDVSRILCDEEKRGR
jgi:hypothetical protein